MKRSFCIFTLLSIAAARSWACDLCGCSVQNQHFVPDSGFFLGVTEQFTRYGTVQSGSTELDNDAGQRLESSITQAIAGYRFSPWVSVQANIPVIARSFRRTTESGIENGDVSGFGDVSLLAIFTPLNRESGDFQLIARLIGGVKFPTGDSDRLGEEAQEGHEHGGETGHHEHQPSAVHGHDLALGSGSVDVIVGANVYARWKRAFVAAELQYAIRTEGDFNYRYDNDLTWSAGPGVELIDAREWRVAAQLVCSGETKGEDEFRGDRADDTAVTTVFLGPRITANWQRRLHGALELDAPVHSWNSGVQMAPDYRIRAELGWDF